MKILIKIPLDVPDDSKNLAEIQQNLSDLFFRDLLTAKQLTLLETFSLNHPGSPEQLAAMREALKEEIKLVEMAKATKTIELISAHETV
jgi:hypothetical protein